MLRLCFFWMKSGPFVILNLSMSDRCTEEFTNKGDIDLLWDKDEFVSSIFRFVYEVQGYHGFVLVDVTLCPRDIRVWGMCLLLTRDVECTEKCLFLLKSEVKFKDGQIVQIDREFFPVERVWLSVCAVSSFIMYAFV